jgi:cell division protease FtsH
MRFSKSLPRLILTVFLVVFAAFSLTGIAQAANKSAPKAAPKNNGYKVTTVAGTLTRTLNDANPSKETISYEIISQGTSYVVDFSNPTATYSGPQGHGKPNATMLQGTNGAQVEITGVLHKGILTAVSTRFISPAPAIAATVANVGIGQKISTFLTNYGMGLFLIVFAGLLVIGFKSMPKSKMEKIKPEAAAQITWDDVAGCDEAKAELQEIVDFMRNPKRFLKLGATVPRGVLLHGPPGTGKTLLAKAVAKEAHADFFCQSASSFVEMFAGLGAARVRKLFKAARKSTPAIIFIDELDAVGGKRGNDLSRENDQTLNQLLVEMDGFADSSNIVVIAASNRLDSLDDALLRPGRFDRQILVSAPGLEGRREILGVHSKNKPVQNVDLNKVAKQTAGLTGADLANLCNEAAIFAARRKADYITQRDFEEAFERVVAGLVSSKIMGADEKKAVAYHEAGHAVVAEIVKDALGPHKISIVPHGTALGYTMHLPDEDKYLQTNDELFDHMTVLIAGRVAEEIFIGRVTTGASDDLNRMTSASRAMLEQFGMGEHLMTHTQGPGPFGARSPFSESFQSARDKEQSDLMQKAKNEATRIITENKDFMEKITQILLDQEEIDRDEIDAIYLQIQAERIEKQPKNSSLVCIDTVAKTPASV